MFGPLEISTDARLRAAERSSGRSREASPATRVSGTPRAFADL
jgi:hypothetical protein